MQHTTQRPTDPSAVPVADRREHPRYALSLAITMRGDNNFYTGLSENISETGVFIATHHVLPLGTPVLLSFTLPDAPEPIMLSATVQWVRGPDATATGANLFGDHSGEVKPGMGVQFVDADDASIAIIRAFMRRRAPDFFA